MKLFCDEVGLSGRCSREDYWGSYDEGCVVKKLFGVVSVHISISFDIDHRESSQYLKRLLPIRIIGGSNQNFVGSSEL